MPASQRRAAAGVINQLLAKPRRFEFFQAVHLIELWLRQNGLDPDGDYLRFRNRMSLSFPPAQIDSLQTPAGMDEASTLLAALRSSDLHQIDLTPAFMGFLGGNGVLPLHYTQRLAEHEANSKSDGPRAFFDLFSHRAVALFYQAWQHHRLDALQDVRGEDTLLPLLQALAGAPAETPDARIARYAAQWRARSMPADIMASVLADYFGVTVHVQPLVGHWQDVPMHDQAQLGVANVSLAAGVLLGTRVYSRDSRVRVRIGPLEHYMFEQLLPGAPASLALKDLLGKFSGAGLTFEIQLVLPRQDVHGITLGGGARLGNDAFLCVAPETRDRDDLCYLLQP